ncbi:MAG: hypothetical protein CVT49_15750 [candidate division Zixibacteria bacterium HGW-Zixibacteria-1]|nr:MAG: hypothetical protein CVT49_15750 [candidate division Zixibacteria bacterium HGW-Zixibacteria-1]
MYENPNAPNPINLKEQYGDRFKIDLDEAADCEGESRKDPWYYLIPCKYGDIYPFSDRRLAFLCNGAGIRSRLHKEQPEIEVHNWSDNGEAIFIFDPEQFHIIAEYAKPRRKRKVSQKERQRLVEMSRNHSPFASINGSKTGQESTNEGQPVSNCPPVKNKRSESCELK